MTNENYEAHVFLNERMMSNTENKCMKVRRLCPTQTPPTPGVAFPRLHIAVSIASASALHNILCGWGRKWRGGGGDEGAVLQHSAALTQALRANRMTEGSRFRSPMLQRSLCSVGFAIPLLVLRQLHTRPHQQHLQDLFQTTPSRWVNNIRFNGCTGRSEGQPLQC